MASGGKSLAALWPGNDQCKGFLTMAFALL